MNLTKAAVKPNILARGTLSLIENPKNIIITGMFIPAPPIPPAVPRIVRRESTSIPRLENMVGGQMKGVKARVVSEDSVILAVELS